MESSENHVNQPGNQRPNGSFTTSSINITQPETTATPSKKIAKRRRAQERAAAAAASVHIKNDADGKDLGSSDTAVKPSGVVQSSRRQTSLFDDVLNGLLYYLKQCFFYLIDLIGYMLKFSQKPL
jgi:hypothetical protein